jgi:hypothetical protein
MLSNQMIDGNTARINDCKENAMCLSDCLYFFLSLSLSMCVCLSVCMYVCLSFCMIACVSDQFHFLQSK